MPPERFGRYQVLEPLGQGAMGAVYKARDPAIDRLVAVKTVGQALLAFPEHRAEYLARFQQEARAAGRLTHPGIVSVYDVGVDAIGGTPYIVMEYVPGVTLATVLRENPTLPVAQAVDIVEQIGAALEEAHGQGIVHRDVKPGNVFLDTRGRVKVGDFGIARVEGSDLTQTGVGLGTPGYLAPEVLRGGQAGPQSDLFALGVVAYQLLTGRKPFGATTPQSAGLEVLQDEPPAPHELRSEVPATVSRAVMRSLAKSPDQRPVSVAAFLAELRGTPPPGSRRGVGLGLLAAAALALMVGAALLAVRYWRSEDAPAAVPPATAARRAAPTPRPPPATPALTPPKIAWPQPEEGDKGKKKDDGQDKSHGRGKKKKGH